MKSKLRLLSFLMLLTVATNYGQSSAETSGIAVQGIARDANNTARAGKKINVTFSIYYKILDVAQTPAIVEYTEELTTDPFGVFSHVITNPYTNNAKFANYQMWLKISEGATVISDEKLKHVPYAIAANNGVPTGSIMPFVGTKAQLPTGWLMCDGVTTVPNPSVLYDLIGGTTPNLGGMFLRGAGDNTNPGYEVNDGPALNMPQQDSNIQHSHSSGSLVNDPEANHQHPTLFATEQSLAGFTFTGASGNIPAYYKNNATSAGTATISGIASIPIPNPTVDLWSKPAGGHNHTISGSTANAGTGNVETRPVSYGVNYIIKL